MFNGFPNRKPDSEKGSNIKSIQRGSATMNALTVNVAISAVDITKSIVKIYMRNTAVSGTGYLTANAEITTSTNLRLAVVAIIVGTEVVDWEIIEFNNVKSLQKGTKVVSTTSEIVTITGVEPTKSVLFISWDAPMSSNMHNLSASGELTNSTTITLFQASSGVVRTIKWQVIEFN